MSANPRCAGCVHPPHIGRCNGRNGQTAYRCGCCLDTVGPPASAPQEFPFGDPHLQFRMRRTLRKLLADARQLEPKALGFILIGIPSDRACRIAHTLRGVDDAYRLMGALVDQHKRGAVEKISHEKMPEE